MASHVGEMNSFLGSKYHAAFSNQINVTMLPSEYPGPRLAEPVKDDLGNIRYDHLYEAPNLGGLTSGSTYIYLAPADRYWVGLAGSGKTLQERFIHELVHASTPGIGGEHDPHKPAFYYAEQEWYRILGFEDNFPSSETAALNQRRSNPKEEDGGVESTKDFPNSGYLNYDSQGNIYKHIEAANGKPARDIYNAGSTSELPSLQKHVWRTDIMRQIEMSDGTSMKAVVYAAADGRIFVKDPVTGKMVDPATVLGLGNTPIPQASGNDHTAISGSGPVVETRSGASVTVGTTFEKGGYTYRVNADRSITNLQTGHTTSGSDGSTGLQSNGSSQVGSYNSDTGWAGSGSGNKDGIGGKSAMSPVIFDLDGDGIEVTPVTSSNMFFDTAGDGKQHRTAWAGAGDGVLVRDAGNDGVITLNNEYDFTQWDPTAKSDMQALLSVFDTNHDGKLNAGDADWALFKIMVTNADGTTTLKTMAELGITSIGLVSNQQEVMLSDGSIVAGTATYTKSNGTTGTVGDVSLVYDPNGYVVAKTVTVNGDGSTTIDNKAYDASGNLANETISTISANGLSRTMKFDNNGDGVTDRLQTDVTVVNSGGSTTRTLQDYDGSGTILGRKEVTLTSADQKTITVSRDLDGSGSNDQTEVRVTGSGGNLTVTITDLHDDGSAQGHMTTVTSADGLSKTTQIDLTGSNVINATRAEATAVGGTGTRTETAANYAGSGTTTGNRISQTVTVTSADGTTKTITSDLDGDGDTDLTTASVLVHNANGSTTTTSSHNNGNASLRDQMVTDLSADGFSKTTRVDMDGNGTHDLTTSDVRTVTAGVTTDTTTETYSNGTRHSQTVETWTADFKTRSTSIDSDGDGTFDHIETVATFGGNSVDTASVYSGNGVTLLSKAVTTTSANGLVRTSQMDTNGDLTFDAVMTSTTVWNVDGSSTVTAISSNGAGTTQIGKTITTTSADGLSMTMQSYLNAQTAPYKTVTDVKVLNSGGSTTETVITFAGTSQVQIGKSVVEISADRLTETVKTYLNTNALPKIISITVTNIDGTKTQTVSDYSLNGATLIGKTITTISPDGLTTTTTQDANGDAVIDARATTVTLLNTDGTTTTTTTSYSGSGTAAANKIGQTVVTTSANGLSQTTQQDTNGDGVFDVKTTKLGVLNADGSKTVTTTNFNGAGTIQTSKTISTVSDDGLSKSESSFHGNHTTADMVKTDVTVLNVDGSSVQTVSTNSGNGTLMSKTTTTTSGNGRSVTVATDLDGNTVNDEVTTVTTNADGSVTTVASTYNAAGTLTARSTQVISGNGFSTSLATDLDGNGTTDKSKTDVIVINADGSKTETISNFGVGGVLKDKSVITNSADGLSVTQQWDGTGVGTFSRTRTDVTTINADGSQTRVVSNLNPNSSLHDRTTTVTTADGTSVTRTEDINGDGTIDHTIVQTKNADGSVTVSAMDGLVQLASGRIFGSLHGRYDTTDATGLSRTIRYEANGNGLAERQTTDIVVLNANGSKVETITNSNLTGGDPASANPIYTVTLTDKAVITTSADGRSVTTQWDLTGVGSFGKSRTEVTTLATDGSVTKTTSTFTNATLDSRFAETTSADGLTTTKNWDATGTGIYNENSVDVVVKNPDGTTTETVTNTNASGALLSKFVTTTSRDGRNTTVQKDLTGAGTFQESQTTTNLTLADGTTVLTLSHFNAAGTLVDKTTTQRSGDGMVESANRDTNGDGITDQTDVVTKSVDGSSTRVITDLNTSGVKTAQSTSVTSADGLVMTSQGDVNADGIIDRTTNHSWTYNADGSTVETVQIYQVSQTAANGTVTTITPVLQQTSVTTMSADSRTQISSVDVDGNGTNDEISTTIMKADGSIVTTVTDNIAARSVAPLPGQVIWSSAVATSYKTTASATLISISADGLSKTVQADYDGNGTYEHTEIWKTKIDGSQVATITDVNASGVVVASGTETISADGKISILLSDSTNSGLIDNKQTSITLEDMSTVKTFTILNANGTLQQTIVTTVSSNGQSSSMNITGGAGNDVLTGGAGNDTLNGGGGADLMTGGKGNDAYVVDNIGDVIVENATEGTDSVQSSVTYTLAANVENLTLTGSSSINGTGNASDNTLTGNTGNNVLSGLGGNDTLTGGTGNDTLNGGDGDDVLNGGAGADVLIGGNGIDTVTYATATSGIVLYLAEPPATNEGDAAGDTFSSIEIIRGTNFADTISVIAANATVYGGAGNDKIYGSGNVNTFYGEAGDDTVFGDFGNDRLDGGADNDYLFGYTGDDVLIGGSGADDLWGGDGFDIASYETATSGVLVNCTNLALNTGDAAGDTYHDIEGIRGSSFADTLIILPNSAKAYGGAGNDNITLLGSASFAYGEAGDDILLGDANSDTLDGGDGNDTLNGGTGADTMIGGDGNDTYVVDNVGDVVTELSNQGTDLVQSSIAYALGVNLENLTLTGTASVNGTGNSLNNVITGNSGNNVLNGGAGADTLIGGGGNDTYLVDDAGDTVTEAAAAGTDLVQSSVTFALGGNVENLTLTGAAAINATGNGLDNILIGNSAANVIDGGAGADTMTGGDGSDTYVVDNAGDVVTEAAGQGTDLVQASVTYTLGANVENLTLLGSAAINGTGNSLNNVIIGNAGANTLNAGGGNDTLDGGLGADTLIGGAGNDTYVVDNVGDSVTEAASEGTDLVQSSVTFTLGANLENLTLTGLTSINGTGNSLDNVLNGNSGANTLSGGDGNDTLDGGAGADTMIGGNGNDVYVVDNIGDVVTESGTGTDTVQSFISYTLGANLENLTLLGAAAINGTGNSLNNIVLGNAGNNTLVGAAGNDTLNGGDGDDVLDGGAGADVLIGGNGIDTATYETATAGIVLYLAEPPATNGGDAAGDTFSSIEIIRGSNFADTIAVIAANAIVYGGAGNDTIYGSGNVNTFYGEAGDDNMTGDFGNDRLDGGIGNDYLFGYTGDDVLIGGSGADDLWGGDGFDIASYETATAGIVFNSLNLAANTGDAAGDTFDSIEGLRGTSFADNLTIHHDAAKVYGGGGSDAIILSGASSFAYGEAGDDTLTGGAGLDTLDGGDGNDILNGGTGADTMIGGDGNDTYVVDSTGDVVTELSGQGTDLVQAAIAYTLGANVENLTLTGTASINGTGNSLNNVITGNSGANILNGGAGADTLIGGGGNDTYIVDNIGDVVIEAAGAGTDLVQSSVTFSLSSDVDNLTLTGSAAINGTGNALANVLTGNAGVNILDGSAGADTMVGGDGSDTYVVDNAGDIVTEAAGQGTDLVQSSVTYTLGTNVENLTLTGTAAINGTGNSGSNILIGNSGANVLSGGDGNDTLDGGAGADTLIGGNGNDIYVVDNAGDVVTESGTGNDLVQSSISYTLGANLENLTLTGSGAINGTGNALDNIINGNSGNNILNGGAGYDSIDGGLGADTLIGGFGNDILVGGMGDDIFVFNAGSDDDTIEDFQVHSGQLNGDIIELHDQSVSTFAALMANATETGGTAFIHLDGGDTIALHGVSLASLDVSDFRFV
ncbi:Ca2+-binding RTX toxin-like protein [Devosia sp. UYZn731]|uniref:beta strand repeat-containing protein n=1 Tax=Devosia sp. UYZn731 TaxID=3156345 RepID=UPI00339615FE